MLSNSLYQALLEITFQECVDQFMFSYVQRRSEIWRENPSIRKWKEVFDCLSPIDRLSAYRLLGTFPDFIDRLPYQTEEERVAVEGASLEYSAKSAWLISLATDWKDERLFHPERFNFPENSWSDYKPYAILSQAMFNMIDAACDYQNKLSGGNTKPGLIWLMTEAAFCRNKFKPALAKPTINSIYLEAKRYREDVHKRETENNLLPFELVRNVECESIIGDETSGFWSDRMLNHADQVVVEWCRRIAARDEEFDKFYWRIYWKIHKSFYSHIKKKGFEPITVNEPARKGNRKQRRKKKRKR